MRLPTAIALSVATVPVFLTFVRSLKIYGKLEYAIRFSILAGIEFLILAQRAYDTINTSESDLLISIYQRTYERSIRFVPVISFLTISVVALYALAPIVVLLLLLPMARYSSRITYNAKIPFFSDLKKALAEFIKTFFGLFVILLIIPVRYALNGHVKESLYAWYYPIYKATLELALNSPKILHDAFVTYSPVATLIAAVIAIGARAGAKKGIVLAILSGAALKYYSITNLAITAFVFATALYEWSAMNISKSLMTPNVGGLSRIVPLGFTIVMTFIGGSVERLFGAKLIPGAFISLITYLSLALGLVLIRYLIKLPTISGMKFGVIKI
jgi:hypothetical protein